MADLECEEYLLPVVCVFAGEWRGNVGNISCRLFVWRMQGELCRALEFVYATLYIVFCLACFAIGESLYIPLFLDLR